VVERHNSLGEDNQRTAMDIVPRRLPAIIVTRSVSLMYAVCRVVVQGRGIWQASATSVALDRGGMPTVSIIASINVSKSADHLPLYPQSQIYCPARG